MDRNWYSNFCIFYLIIFKNLFHSYRGHLILLLIIIAQPFLWCKEFVLPMFHLNTPKF